MAVAEKALGRGTKLVYGLGSAAFGIKDAGFNTFLLIYYNQVLGVSATLVSFAIMIALVADAILNPIIGEVSDNWRSRLGRRHPFMYAAALPSALFYFLLWNPPHLPANQLFVYLVALAILVRIAIAVYEIPSMALAPELSPDYDGRTSLMAYRFLFQILGNGVTVAVALAFLMKATAAQPTGILNRNGYFAYSVMAAVLILASILASAYGTRGRIAQLRQLPPRRHTSFAQIAREMFQSLSNGPFLVVTVSSLFGGIAMGIVTALGTYFGTYFWKFTPQQLSVLGLAALIAAAISAWLAPAASKRFQKKRAYMITAFSSLLVTNVAMTLKLFGLLPPDGSGALLAVFFVTTTIGLALAIASFIIVLSMITDVVEDSEIKTGRRSEGLFSASISFVNKATSGFGVLIAGILIDLVHFPAHASVATIDPAIPRNLALIYMPTQLFFFVLAISVLSFYRIDRETHESNLARLAEAAALAEESEEGTLVRDAVARPETVSAAPLAAPSA
jgi:Na+/melibiose symporter-like transporter